MSQRDKLSGFTLVEVVIVIAILGLLAGIGIPRYLDFSAKARGSKIVTELRTLDSALAVYAAKTGNIPIIDVNGHGSDVLTTNDPANGKMLLLTEWPSPPTGDSDVDIIFPCQPDKTLTIAAGDGFYFTDDDGRARFVSADLVFASPTGSGCTAEDLGEKGAASYQYFIFPQDSSKKDKDRRLKVEITFRPRSFFMSKHFLSKVRYKFL